MRPRDCWAAVQATDPVASHASWMENFPWTRLEGVELPDMQKPMSNRAGRPRYNERGEEMLERMR